MLSDWNFLDFSRKFRSRSNPTISKICRSEGVLARHRKDTIGIFVIPSKNNFTEMTRNHAETSKLNILSRFI